MFYFVNILQKRIKKRKYCALYIEMINNKYVHKKEAKYDKIF